MEPSFDELAQAYVASVQRMDALMLRCMGLADDGDRDSYFVHDSYTFLMGSLQEQDLILNNPVDAAFYGARLNLFLDSRLTDQSNDGGIAGPNNQKTFRPSDWTPTNDWPGGIQIHSANCMFTVRTPRGYYNPTPMAISHAFSTRHGSSVGTMPASAYLGGLDFHRPYPLARGEAMTVRVSPNYTRWLAADGSYPDDTSVPEFRVTAVLQGYKKVRAFR